MRGDELRVARAFGDWLEAQGWSVQCEVDYCDVYAEKGDQRIFAEAKGRTAAMGLDIDTLYGQLLRRMGEQPREGVRFAVVVPEEGLAAALRVKPWIREVLSIDVYAVALDGTIRPSPKS